MKLEHISVIPLDTAFLCPDCDAVTNLHDCPLCHSETLVLSRILNRTTEGEMHDHADLSTKA